MSDEAHKLK